MKKYYIILLLFVSFISVKAQNTGYMGNRFFFNFDATLSPAWKKPNIMSDVTNSKYLGLHAFATPSVEAVVWRLGSVGVGYNFFTAPDEESASYNNEPVDYKISILGHGFSIYYKQYLGKTKAPLGQFIKIQFDTYFLSYKNQYLSNNKEFDTFFENYLVSEKTNNFGLRCEYGYDFLFFDRLRVTTGISLGLMFKGIKHLIDTNYYMQLSPDVLSEHTQFRLASAYFLGLHVGIGILAF